MRRRKMLAFELQSPLKKSSEDKHMLPKKGEEKGFTIYGNYECEVVPP